MAIAYLFELVENGRASDSEALCEHAWDVHKKAGELSGQSYNLACVFALKLDRINALGFLGKRFKNRGESIGSVLGSEDWGAYDDDEGFKKIISRDWLCDLSSLNKFFMWKGRYD